MTTRNNFLLMSWHTKFLKTAVWYNAVVFSLFLLAYLLIDFEKHFKSDEPVSTKGKVYYAVMAHTSSGPDGIAPRTDFGRMLTSLHVTLAWMQLMIVFLS